MTGSFSIAEQTITAHAWFSALFFVLACLPIFYCIGSTIWLVRHEHDAMPKKKRTRHYVNIMWTFLATLVVCGFSLWGGIYYSQNDGLQHNMPDNYQQCILHGDESTKLETIIVDQKGKDDATTRTGELECDGEDRGTHTVVTSRDNESIDVTITPGSES